MGFLCFLVDMRKRVRLIVSIIYSSRTLWKGRINGQQWSEIVQTKDWEIEAAARAWDELDANEVKKIMDAQVNIGYKLLRQ